MLEDGIKKKLTARLLALVVIISMITALTGCNEPKEQESAEEGLERRTRPVGHALVHRDVKHLLYGVKKGKATFGQQAVWQQAGGRKKPEEVCSYSKQN